MKALIFVFLLAITCVARSQDKWSISARAVGLPSLYCNFEVHYSGNNNKVKHYHKKGTTDCFPKRHKGGKKSKNEVGFESYQFLIENFSDSTYWLSYEHLNTSEIDLNYLKSRNMANDSCLQINFPLFERQYFKPDTSDIFSRFRGYQIDGVRVIIYFIQEKDTLLNLNIGASEQAQVENFKDWILFSETYHKFGLFSKLNMEELFDRKSMTYEIKEYVESLKR